MERGSWINNEERLEANDVYWLKVSPLPCSEASADHNFRVLLHLVVLSDTDVDCLLV